MSNSAEIELKFTVGRDGAWQIGHYSFIFDKFKLPFNFPKSKTRRREILKKLLEPLIWHAELSENFGIIKFRAKLDRETADLIIRLINTEKTPAKWLRKIDPNRDPEEIKFELEKIFIARGLK